jgi:hypothetical protein
MNGVTRPLRFDSRDRAEFPLPKRARKKSCFLVGRVICSLPLTKQPSNILRGLSFKAFDFLKARTRDDRSPVFGIHRPLVAAALLQIRSCAKLRQANAPRNSTDVSVKPTQRSRAACKEAPHPSSSHRLASSSAGSRIERSEIRDCITTQEIRGLRDVYPTTLQAAQQRQIKTGLKRPCICAGRNPCPPWPSSRRCPKRRS